jgi:hypothetical protein
MVQEPTSSGVGFENSVYFFFFILSGAIPNLYKHQQQLY